MQQYGDQSDSIYKTKPCTSSSSNGLLGRRTPSSSAPTRRYTSKDIATDIDAARDSYPFCIVWTPLPFISWFLPFIGHMGIADSTGVIYDFAGSYCINKGNMAFGSPVKYYCLFPSHLTKLDCSNTNGSVSPGADGDSSDSSARLNNNNNNNNNICDVSMSAVDIYDAAIHSTADRFRKTQSYCFFFNNCHSFVAYCLEESISLAAKGSVQSNAHTSWNMVKLTIYMAIYGKYISAGHFCRAHLSFIIVLLIIFSVSFGVVKGLDL